MTVSLDMQYNRLSFSPKETQKVHHYNAKFTDTERCTDFIVYVRGTLTDIFRPITIEAKYDTIEKIPEASQEFCETCVALDPREGKLVSTKLTFSTGCSADRCVSDLQLVGTLINVRQPYVLGSTQSIGLQYEISNAGESAYLTQLKITIPSNITQFSRVPAICREESNKREMICDINQGRPVANGQTVKLDVSLDASKLEGELFVVVASVTSSGDEQKPADNEYINEIIMTEFSDVEFNGRSSDTQLSLEDGLKVKNMQYSYKIYNNGPSTIKELNLAIQIPLSYIPRANFYVPIVDFNSMNMTGFYLNKVYEVTWLKHNQILLQSSEDLSEKNPLVAENMNTNFDSSKLGFDYEFNAPTVNENVGHHNHRRRRSLWQNEEEDKTFRVYNQYTASIDEYHASYRVSHINEDQTLKNLPKNRTINFDCSSETSECVEAIFTINNFRPGSEPITINLNFTIDLFKIGEKLKSL